MSGHAKSQQEFRRTPFVIARRDRLPKAKKAPTEAAPEADVPPTEVLESAMPAVFLTLAHASIRPDPDNARKAFEDDKLADLAATILTHGLLQPLIVEDADPEGVHTLVAGERRWRAIGLLIARGDLRADWPIAVRLTSADDEVHAEMALIENLQRVDLNHMEAGLAFETLGTRFHLSNKRIAEKIGRSAEYVQQHRRLAQLDEDDQAALRAGDMTMHEAIAIIAKPKPATLGPAVMLALVEIAHKCESAPRSRGYAGTEIASNAPTDGVFKQLRERGLIQFEARSYVDLRTYAWLSWEGRDLAEQAVKAISLEDDWRGVFAILRERAAVPPAIDPTLEYATAWLNGPFELSAEAQVELERRKDAATEDKRVKTEAKATREKSLVEVRGLEAGLGVEPVPLARERARAQLASLGFKGPFVANGNRLIVDANGKTLSDVHWQLGEDGHRAAALIAFALNFAAFDPYAGLRVPTPADAALADLSEDAEIAASMKRLAGVPEGVA
jgi:ParB/RepB/Spo0J family partition protein